MESNIIIEISNKIQIATMRQKLIASENEAKRDREKLEALHEHNQRNWSR